MTRGLREVRPSADRPRRPNGGTLGPGARAPLLEALADREAEAVSMIRAAGKSFLGVVGVLAQKPTARPAPGEPRRKLNPRVACRDKWRRIEALQRLTTFLCEYRAALKEWTRGVRDVVFPAGTYLLRLNHAVCCAAP